MQAIEQLTVTTLRNVIGGMTLEETLTSRDNDQLAAARRARRGDRQVGHPRQPRRAQVGRAAAHGAGGDGEADARRARPPRRDPHGRGRQAVPDPHRRGREAGRRPEGRGRAHGRDPAAPRASPRRSRPSSQAIHAGVPDERLLAYQYLQMLPQLAQGSANKVFVIPSEFSQAFAQLGNALGGAAGDAVPNGAAAAAPRAAAPAHRAQHRRDRREGSSRRRGRGAGRAPGGGRGRRRHDDGPAAPGRAPARDLHGL